MLPTLPTIFFMIVFCQVASAAPDEEVLGRSKGYPVYHDRRTFNYADQYLVGTLSNMSKLYPTVISRSGDQKLRFEISSDPLPSISYNYRQAYTLEDYLGRNRVTGIMIIKDGKVLLERYRYDRKPEHQFSSMSMAKSITAILVGIAHEEKLIESLDDLAVKYVPRLKSTAYAKVTIRNLLRMLSGVKFVQGVDSIKLSARTWWDREGRPGERAVDFIEETAAEQGKVFNYINADTFVLGLVLRAATKRSIADYMSEKMWVPMGAEFDATWIVDSDKVEVTSMGLNATLRDYAKVGMLLANDGFINGKQIVSKEFLLDATDPERQPEVNKPITNGKNIGYGYQIWIHPFETRTFALYGHHGQSIFVQPETKTVIVMTQAWAESEHRRLEAERFSFHIGMLRSLGAKAKLNRVTH